MSEDSRTMDDPPDDGTVDRRGSDEGEDALEQLFRSTRVNAVLSWLLVGVLVLAFVESAIEFDRQWLTFVGAVAAIVLFPPAAYGNWRVMLPWELLLVALLPVLVRAVFGGEVGLFASYVAVAGLALIVTVELHTFTSLEVTHWFAVTFVVLTTMASAAAWTVVRWNFNRAFGTSYLSTNEALMTEWLWVTVAGVAAGILFDVYFTRRDRQLWQSLRGVVGR